MDILIIILLVGVPFVLIFLCILALVCWPRARDSEGLAGCCNRRIRRKLRPSVVDASTLQGGVSRKQRLSDVDFGALNVAASIAPGQQVKVFEPILSIAGEEVAIWRPSKTDQGKVVGYTGPAYRPMAELKLGDTWRYEHITLVVGDLGSIVRLDARGDALVHFEWDKKELWIDRQDFRSLLLTSELRAHCGEDCTKKHDEHSKCLTCGESWSQHQAGHKCLDGGRGSFLISSLKQGQAAWALHDGTWKAGEVQKLEPLRVALDEWRPRPPVQPEPSTAQKLGFDEATCRLFGYPARAQPQKEIEKPKVEPIPDLILATEYVPLEMPRPGFLCGCGDGGSVRGPERITPANPAKLLQEGRVYTWAWGDLPLAASLNPLRWSSYMTRHDVASELRKYDNSTNFRPVHVMDRWDGNMMFCDARVAIAQLGAKTDESNPVADRHMFEIVCCFPDKKMDRSKFDMAPPLGQ